VTVATKTILTLDQFLTLPERESDGTHYELSKGELIKLPPPGYRHGAIVIRIGALLASVLPRDKYVVTGADAGFLLHPNPEAATVRGADVAVNTRDSVGKDLPYGWFPGAPLLAVEVVSPSNSAKDMRLKVEQYIEAGGREVWLVYPEKRTVHVYSAGTREPRVFGESDTFDSVVHQSFRVANLFDI
jgi:Uma2 family endonuclease